MEKNVRIHQQTTVNTLWLVKMAITHLIVLLVVFFLDQRALGMSMRVERASLDQVLQSLFLMNGSLRIPITEETSRHCFHQ